MKYVLIHWDYSPLDTEVLAVKDTKDECIDILRGIYIKYNLEINSILKLPTTLEELTDRAEKIDIERWGRYRNYIVAPGRDR